MKMTFEKILLGLCSGLLAANLTLISIIYKDQTALIKAHESKLHDHDIRLSVIEQQIFYIGGEKKNKIGCNFKTYAIVNICSKKKKKEGECDLDMS
jgi:hypothetical protein